MSPSTCQYFKFRLQYSICILWSCVTKMAQNAGEWLSFDEVSFSEGSCNKEERRQTDGDEDAARNISYLMRRSGIAISWLKFPSHPSHYID